MTTKSQLLALTLLLGSSLATTVQANPGCKPANPDAAAPSKPAQPGRSSLSANAGPAGFLQNVGEIKDQAGRTNAAVKYLLQLPGMNVQLRAGGFSYDTYMKEKGCNSYSFHRVDISLEGANTAAQLLAEKPLAALRNYYLPGGCISAHSYGEVTYKDIYPGIDLQFIAGGSAGKPVEYNFIVHPGGDASQIKLKYNGANGTELNGGKIVLSLATGNLAESIPSSFIEKTGQSVRVAYAVAGGNKEVYAFSVPRYDRSKTLVIDPTPTFVWGTFFGGMDDAQSAGVALDPSGNAFMHLTVTNAGLATAGAYKTSFAGYSSVMVVKFNPAGNLLWATYYGGGNEYASGVATDQSGNVFVCGGNAATTGIATAGAFQTSHSAGMSNAYLAKFTGTGALAWATYYGGNGNANYAYAVTTDPTGNVYIVGGTNSTTGIASAGAYQTAISGTDDGFIAKFSNGGTRLFGTYYGGTNYEYISAACTDASGNLFFGGQTYSSNGIASAGAFSSSGPSGGYGAQFLASFNGAGTRLWGTYYGLGGNGITSVACDPSGNLLVGGSGYSSGSYYGTPGTSRPTGFGGFVSKFSGGGARVWSTYLGTNGTNYCKVAADANGNVYAEATQYYMTGVNISTPNAPQTVLNPNGVNGQQDVAIIKYNSAGTVQWGTYYGGDDEEDAGGIAVDNSFNVYVTGNSFSSGPGVGGNGYMNTNPAFSNWEQNAFLARFSQGSSPMQRRAELGTATADAAIYTDLHDLRIRLTNADGKAAAYIVYSADGKTVSSAMLVEGSDAVISALSSGMYMVRVTDAAGAVIKMAKVSVR